MLDTHVLPLIDELASRPFDLTGLSAPKLPAFDAAPPELTEAVLEHLGPEKASDDQTILVLEGVAAQR